MIQLKTEEEVAVIERNSQLLVRIMDEVDPLVAPGHSTAQIDREVQRLLRQYGAEPALLGYAGYPAGICANVNDGVTNCLPSDRVLESGDILTLQVGIQKDGYFSKVQHCYPIGAVSREARAVQMAAKSAVRRGIQAAVVGNRVSDISHAIGAKAESEGYSVVREYVGHGIGIELHEDPQIPCYGPAGHGIRLREGMVLQILALLTEGTSLSTRVGPDKWSVRTRDGSRACTVGHVVAVAKDNARVLTFSPRDHYLDETVSRAIAILPIGDWLHVQPLDELGIHNVIDPRTRETIIWGPASAIQSKTKSFSTSEIEEFEELINSPTLREHYLQTFFERHPNFLLGTDYQSLRTGIILPNDTEPNLKPDFFLEPIGGKLWDILELKLPDKQIVVGRFPRRRFAAAVFDACAQLRTYRDYFSDERNRSRVLSEHGILVRWPRLAVIIGRAPNIDEVALRAIQQDFPWVRIITFDELLQKAKRRILY